MGARMEQGVRAGRGNGRGRAAWAIDRGGLLESSVASYTPDSRPMLASQNGRLGARSSEKKNTIIFNYDHNWNPT